MIKTKYMKKLISLSIELERAGNARPYDPNAYNKVIDQLNSLFDSKGKRRRRRPSFFAILIWILFGILIGLVFRILFLT